MALARKYRFDAAISDRITPVGPDRAGHQGFTPAAIKEGIEKADSTISKGSVQLTCFNDKEANEQVDKWLLKEVRICLHPVSLKPVHCGPVRYKDVGCTDRVHYPKM